jgi:hypothetical protein
MPQGIVTVAKQSVCLEGSLQLTESKRHKTLRLSLLRAEEDYSLII